MSVRARKLRTFFAIALIVAVACILGFQLVYHGGSKLSLTYTITLDGDRLLMSHNLVYVIYWVFAACLPAFVRAQPVNSKIHERIGTAHRFEDLFEHVRDIELQVELIGKISQLEVAGNGNLLVVDQMMHKTWLFDSAGTLLKDINVQTDYPGVKWWPTGAWFGENNTILTVVSGARVLFLFDSKGKYLTAINTFFPQQYADFVIDKDGHIYGYATKGSAPLTVKKLDPKGSVLRTGGIFPEKYKNFISRSAGGGLVIDPKGNIYQYNVCGPEIYKLSPELTLIDTFDEKPFYYKQMARDYPGPAGNPAAFMREVAKLRSGVTTTYKIDLLEPWLFIIQYVQPGKEGGLFLNFCDLDGTYLTRNKIVSYRPFIAAARNGVVYLVTPPEPDPDGELLNPKISKYRFVYR